MRLSPHGCGLSAVKLYVLVCHFRVVPKMVWSTRTGLNHQPIAYKAIALPIELRVHITRAFAGVSICRGSQCVADTLSALMPMVGLV